MHKTFYLFLLLFITTFSLRAQNASNAISANNQVRDTAIKRDLIDIAKSLFKIKPKPRIDTGEKRIYFSALPIGANVPGGGRALITSTSAGFYLGNRKTTNISNVTFTPYSNFKSRFGLPLRSNIWLKDNSWNILGDTRFLVYPQYTWGLGSGHNDDKILIDYKYVRFYQSALKRIKPYMYVGLGYNLDYFINAKTSGADLEQFSGYAYGTTAGKNEFSSGVSLNLLYDTRNNSINPLPGCYLNIILRNNPVYLGSKTNWQSLYVDARKYIPLNKKAHQQNVLALWTYAWTGLSSAIPYLNLPSIGWDPYNRSGRGIEQNRYRGKGLIYFESEYRRDITNNGLLGFVVFANATAVTETEKNRFRNIHPAVGSGLRLKFNKSSNTNIAVDYGLSKGYSGFMINLGEAF
ncbi:BamA/TamA family outer membrane protein [Pedobacter sp. MR2016-24]|uniref:BamA/TamA family outer membrane protein n=1 Tax=Pedobacter sp. MR2016-24 TaxID=2994466 RepID=UPI0022470578|nr:BamA/TamA family outer membrane protein [Pedobacter sp. MR2016-24]MCX2483552.1 BamA/TamA family outer membrane protein [Pedobacter sp. MR2016-24]